MIDDTKPYLTTDQLAHRYGLSPATVRGWRKSTNKGNPQGPKWEMLPKIGVAAGQPRVRYYLADVLALEEAKSITPIN